MSTMSRSASVGVGLDASSSSSSSQQVASTRDAILTRYLNRSSGADESSSSSLSQRSKPQMECFESDTPEQTNVQTNNAGVRSDRSLLASIASKKSSSGLSSNSSDDVDTTAIKPNVAFQSFAGSLYNPSSSSLSSTSSQPARSTSGVFESGSDILISNASTTNRVTFESPFTRLIRLQEELREFQSDLAEASQTASKLTTTQSTVSSTDATQSNDAWSILGTNVSGLQQQLDRIFASDQYKSVFESSNSTKSDANGGNTTSTSNTIPLSVSGVPGFDNLFTYYVEQLRQDPKFIPNELSLNTSSAAAAASTSSSSSTTELQTVLPKLDERLAAMEKFIGLANTGKSAGSTSVVPVPGSIVSTSSSSSAISLLPSPDLLTSLTHLHSQLQSLNPTRLEYVVRQLKQIAIEQENIANLKKDETHTNPLNEKKEDGANTSAAAGTQNASLPPYASQISTIYSLTQRWDSLALTLPTIIQRLSSLHALHASCATFSSRTQNLEAATQKIDTALTTLSTNIREVQSNAAANMSQIQLNFAAMEKRIDEITKKQAQLAK